MMNGCFSHILAKNYNNRATEDELSTKEYIAIAICHFAIVAVAVVFFVCILPSQLAVFTA
jgi:hypothetical protein